VGCAGSALVGSCAGGRPFGVVWEYTDANQKVSRSRHDGLGRTTEVRRPDQVTGAIPSVRYTYHVSKTTPSWVQTDVLQYEVGPVWMVSRDYVDGLGRERETQQLSPQGSGRVVTATGYDSHGRVTRVQGPFHSAGALGSNMVTQAGLLGSVPAQTRYLYDRAGRTIETQLLNGSNQVVSATAYRYGGLWSTVQPPVGQRTSTLVDVFGRTVERRAYHSGGGTAGDAYVTSFGYDYVSGGYGRVVVTDPGGNRTETSTDWAGNVYLVKDPNTGTSTYSYDHGNLLVASMGPAGNAAYSYDVLDRPLVSTYTGATGVVIRHQWDAGGESGLLNWRETDVAHPSGTGTETYRFDVAGYDLRDRPVGHRWVLPASVTGSVGSYLFEFGYDAADHRRQVRYPTMGGLLTEVTTTDHTPSGHPHRLNTDGGGNVDLVSGSVFTGIGQVASRATPVGVREYGWDAVTGRLTDQKFTPACSDECGVGELCVEHRRTADRQDVGGLRVVVVCDVRSVGSYGFSDLQRSDVVVCV
jgi:hypothetical protein